MNNPVITQQMKDKGTLKYWILPEQGYNARTVYYEYPISNTPEVMLLDPSLFNDLDKDIKCYFVHISYLAYNNLRKFSLSTSCQASSTFRRVQKGYPSSERIRQNTNKSTHNI